MTLKIINNNFSVKTERANFIGLYLATENRDYASRQILVGDNLFDFKGVDSCTGIKVYRGEGVQIRNCSIFIDSDGANLPSSNKSIIGIDVHNDVIVHSCVIRLMGNGQAILSGIRCEAGVVKISHCSIYVADKNSTGSGTVTDSKMSGILAQYCYMQQPIIDSCYIVMGCLNNTNTRLNYINIVSSGAVISSCKFFLYANSASQNGRVFQDLGSSSYHLMMYGNTMARNKTGNGESEGVVIVKNGTIYKLVSLYAGLVEPVLCYLPPYGNTETALLDNMPELK